MKLKNVSETKTFPAISFYCDKLEDTEFLNKLNRAFSASPEEDLTDLKKEILDTCPANVLESLKNNGVEEPWATIDATTSLSQVVFDIFLKNVVPPVSPLKKKIFEKKIQDFAMTLDGDEIELPEEVSEILKKVLNDDELWTQQQFFVDIGEGKSFYLSYAGIERYVEIITMLINAFLEKE
jgi:hypothetical protein